jgi:hypothetical protein
MQDEPDPPRKIYGFKPREFDRANPTAAPAPAAEAPSASPATSPAPSEKIDIHQLIRTGADLSGKLGSNAVANRDNEVHSMLRANLARDVAAGHYDLGTLDDSKRRRRIRNYWIAIVAFDTPFALFAFWIGHSAAIPFVCSIAAIALFTSYLTWQTFFLRTHY